MSTQQEGPFHLQEPDAEVLQRAQARLGDGTPTADAWQAFQTLGAQYETRLTAYVAYVIDDEEAAHFIAQEALWKAVASYPRIRPMAPFTAWLVKIAKNDSFKLLKARKREGSIEATQKALNEPLESGSARPISSGRLDTEQEIIERDLIRRSYAQLARREREVLFLRHIMGFSVKEMGWIFQVSSSSISQALWRGTLKFKQAYNRSLVLAGESPRKGGRTG
ncbi:MAG TPA: sigma-70 family RNA polymerase sigma factor [Ktedonobacterales bacterium]